MTDWIGKLGALNQYRDVPYVEKAGKQVCCLLCGTGWMKSYARQGHFNGSIHALNYSTVQAAEKRQEDNELMRNRSQKMIEIEMQVSRLGLCKWQNSMKSLMYEYTVHGAAGMGGYDGVINKLRKFERMECASLLELAIWKASICDGLVFTSVVEMRQYKVLEEDFDAAAYSKKRLVESGSQIIIPRVLEFLCKTDKQS
jgi:hypothetical protein